MPHLPGEDGKARSETVERGSAFNYCPSSQGASEIHCDLPELCTNPMQLIGPVDKMKRTGRSFNVFQHRVSLFDVSGKSTATDGPSTKPHESSCLFYAVGRSRNRSKPDQ